MAELPPGRILSRRLDRFEPELVVFLQERASRTERPEAPGPLAWLGLAALAVSAPLLPVPAADRRPVGLPLLVALVLWGLGAIFLVARWGVRRRDWRRAQVPGSLGWFAVRFEKASGLVRLVGPGDPDSLGSASGPEASRLPLERVELVATKSPDHPWSDLSEPEDLRALNLAFTVRDVPPLSDFDGRFDLLDGVEPDSRWYVTEGNREAGRRLRLARELLEDSRDRR